MLSEKWIAKALTPSKTNTSYGYMWWLDTDAGKTYKGAPDMLFSARGFGGNFIVVDQENEIVVVARWLEPSKLNEFLQKLYASLK